LDYWLEWGLFNRQQIAEMQDVEFTSDLMLLLIRGTQPGTKASIDAVYQKYEEDFPELEPCLARFDHFLRLLDRVYRGRGDLRRLVSKMWTYSLADALQRLLYGGPISKTGARSPRKLSVESVVAGCLALKEQLEANELPAE